MQQKTFTRKESPIVTQNPQNPKTALLLIDYDM